MASDPVTPVLGNRAPSSPSNPGGTPSQVQPRPQMTPAQLLADNVSTRVRELGAFAALVLLAYWRLIPGTVAVAIIAAIVLPIEITRQLVKPAVARITGGGGLAAVAGVVTLHKLLTYGAIGGAVLAGLHGCGARQRPWDETARAAIAASAHAVDAADAVVAARYAQEAADADVPQLAALEHRYAGIVAARRAAREALLAAASAVAAARAADAAPARCRAGAALDDAQAALVHVVGTMDAAGVPVPRAIAAALGEVAPLVRVLGPNCGDAP